MTKEDIVFIGKYTSKSGIVLECKIEKLRYKDKNGVAQEAVKEDDHCDCDYMVYFINNAFSASLAKLDLKSYFVMKGKLFFITETEYATFIQDIVNKNTKWCIADKHGDIVELPGQWHTHLGAGNDL
jgi:hypothetical protein